MERQLYWFRKFHSYTYFSVLFLVLINSNLYAKNEKEEWIERRKNITFSYPININDKISLDNQFGDIKVNIWDKNEIKVEVTIVANATSEERASNFISTVNVLGHKADGIVSIKTIIDREEGNYNNNTWSNKGENKEKNSLKIDYQVFMPKNNTLKIKNSFGNISLPNFSATLNINGNYGKLFAENITNPNNDININFCKGSNLKSIVGGKLKAAYSSISAEKIDDLEFINSFGEINIKEVGKVNAKISYSSGLIGNIKESCNFKIDFSGGLKLGELGQNVKEFNLNANYSPISLSLNNNLSYDFEVKSTYGHFSYNDERDIFFTRNTETEAKKNSDKYSYNSTKYYTGKIGKGSPDCKIIINSNFSNVTLK